MLRYDYPTIAAASLVAAHRLVEGAEAVETCGLHSLASFLSRRDVHACAEALGKLHTACLAADGGLSAAGGSSDGVFLPLKLKYGMAIPRGGPPQSGGGTGGA